MIANRYDFSADIYRTANLDLCHLSDAELLSHYMSHRDERRLYARVETTNELCSMRWLRGNGLEIGAGKNPTPLYGNAITSLDDIDDTGVFYGDYSGISHSIDHPDYCRGKEDSFDFVIASHVLEHTDSFLLAIQNMTNITKDMGILYIVMPDINFLHDKYWMANYNFEHHIDEYRHPLCHMNLHDSAFLKYIEQDNLFAKAVHAQPPSDYLENLNKSIIDPKHRFIHHKHNYDFNDWVTLIVDTIKFLGGLVLMDARYGHERHDCHFILEVRK